MKWILRIFALIVIIVGAFYALNSYIYNEKQGEDAKQFRDGEYLGFIHALTDNDTAMDFDDATWLTGVAAQDAAIAAGLCTEETRAECVPNDYFIENSSPKDERVSVNPNALVSMQTSRMEETGEVAEREISLADFSALINDPTLHWNKLPYQITISGGAAIQIEEVYVP